MTAIEWIINIHYSFGFDSGTTVYQAVNFFDRFVGKYKIENTEAQLLALACISVAIKLNETKQAPIRDLAKLTSKQCSLEEAQAAEMNLVASLDHHMAVPTVKVCSSSHQVGFPVAMVTLCLCLMLRVIATRALRSIVVFS
jgi:hypothetical protein